MARLNGASTIVTGTAQGMGATYAKALAAEGARVSVCDIDPPDAVVQAIRAVGGDAIGQVCNVIDPKAVAALVKATERAFGGVQCWSTTRPSSARSRGSRLPRSPPRNGNRVMAVNTRGPFECVKAVLPEMRRQRYGKIINIASDTVFTW
jgi:NAD(P)-dependent dehydrogenase (short-subunit alcohol dehydrogenase family)